MAGAPHNTNVVTTTNYVGGVVYESKNYSNATLSALNYSNKLQFISHEEGRIRPVEENGQRTFVYDYFIKDHLGNVRMVLTDEQKQDIYPAATLEDNHAATEQNYYSINTGNIQPNPTQLTTPADQRYQNNNGIPNPGHQNPTATSEKMYKLNSSNATDKIGLGITLKVMAGDVIDVHGKSFYYQNTSGTSANSTIPIIDLLSAFLNAPAAANITSGHGIVTPADISASANLAGIENMVTQQDNQSNATPNKPRAFINVIFFTEQFKSYDYHVSMVGANSELKDHFFELQNLSANKSGFVYIYCSNESPVNVFFDNLQVVHTKGALLEETHYYPFGLTMQGISSKAAGMVENKKKYQGYEYNTDFDLSLYESFYRTHDPQIGRFWQLDPKPDGRISLYSAMGNNPISLNDLLGDTTRYYNNAGNLLYATYAKGYNNATIVNNGQVEAFNKIVGGLGKLSLKQQAAFDWVAGFLNIGTTYDIGAMSKYYAENGNKNSIEQIDGTPIGSMENFKINGKSADPKSLKAEASVSLIWKDGKITVGNREFKNKDLVRTFAPDNMGSEQGYTGAFMHTHPDMKNGTIEWKNGFSYPTYNIYPNNGPSSADQLKTRGDMQYSNGVRNAVADKKYIYLINGADKQTIKIPR